MYVTAPPPGAATHVFFVPPVPRCKKKVSEEWNVLDGTLQRSPSLSDNTSVISEESFTLSTPGMLVAQLSKTNVHAGICVCSSYYRGEECILDVPAAKHLDDLQMFVSLFPYFNGNHHIEEIMYFENLRRP